MMLKGELTMQECKPVLIREVYAGGGDFAWFQC